MIELNKWENRPFLCRRIPSNLCRCSTLKEVEQNPSFLNCGRWMVNSKEYILERGEKSKFTLEKPDKPVLG